MSEKQAAVSKSRQRRGHDVSSKDITDKQIESLYKKCTALYDPISVEDVVRDVRSHLNTKEFEKDPRTYIREHLPWRDDDLPTTEVALIRYILCRLARLKVFKTDEDIVMRAVEARLKY